jgi:hypothetical protein
LQPGIEIYHLPKPLTGTEQGEGGRRGENIITESQRTQR